jgi:hypothetical protein
MPLALAGPLDAPPHCACRRAGSTTAVPVEEQGAVCLAHDAYVWAGVQLAGAVEVGQHSERCDTVVGVSTKLGLHEEARQFPSIDGRQLQALENDGEASRQIVDPHQAGAFVLPTAVVTCSAVYGRSRSGA